VEFGKKKRKRRKAGGKLNQLMVKLPNSGVRDLRHLLAHDSANDTYHGTGQKYFSVQRGLDCFDRHKIGIG
jgi:hypothetical protein